MLSHTDFPRVHKVEGRASIANLFSPGNRRGIYILSFANGEMYVGKAEDITRRYVQHSKIHGDIVGFTFKQVARRNLAEAELSVLHSLQRSGHVVRNITFNSLVMGQSDFDLIMLPEDQQRWLADLSYIDKMGERPNDDPLRRRYRLKFERFMTMPLAPKVIEILRRYVQVGLPAFRRSEVDFWACSCLPGSPNNKSGVYARVNVYWQEVLTISETERQSGLLRVSLHLACTPLEAAFGSSAGPLVERHPTVRVIEHQHKLGGYDQINLQVDGGRAALSLLNDPDIVRAIRLFNLRLMKKGACRFGHYHCMDLADMFVDG